MVEEPFFLKSHGNNLFGMIYKPETDSYAEGVIICHPFAEEKKSSHRVLVNIARELVKRGYPVLLFDFTACGDSEGEMKDCSILIWREDLNNAIQYFRSQLTLKKVSAIGLRLGSYFAQSISLYEKNVGRIVFIEPVFDLQKYFHRILRRKLINELYTNGTVKSSRNSLLNQLKDQKSIDFDGYEISSIFYEDLTLQKENDTILKQILIINITNSEKISRDYKKYIQFQKLHESKIEFKQLKLQPFWNKIETPDCNELIQIISNYFN